MTAGLPVALLFLILLLTNCGSPTQDSAKTSKPGTSSPTLTSSSSAPCSTPPDLSIKIVITAPCNDARVAQRQFVEGVVTDSNAHVWVVIHPMEAADFWVQPGVTVRDGGKWKVLCYFGEPGPGKHYEVVAFVDPREKIREGQLLSGWPDAQTKSQTIEVIGE